MRRVADQGNQGTGAITTAVARQTSDVSVTSRALRRAIPAQTILGFFFDAAIIGLSIDIRPV